MRLADTLERHILTVIEFMIAETHRVIMHRIHKTDRRSALAEIDEVVVLNGIARVKQENLFALPDQLSAQSGNSRHTVDAALFRMLVISVRIIRMQDDEIGIIGRKCRSG